MIGPGPNDREPIGGHDGGDSPFALRLAAVVAAPLFVPRPQLRILGGVRSRKNRCIVCRNGRDIDVVIGAVAQDARGVLRDRRLRRPHVDDGIPTPTPERTIVFLVRISIAKAAQPLDVLEQVRRRDPPIEQGHGVAHRKQLLDDGRADKASATHHQDPLRGSECACERRGQRRACGECSAGAPLAPRGTGSSTENGHGTLLT
ncbi:MAG: hypothetical protein QM750_24145 [Rubrivivax sp.]